MGTPHTSNKDLKTDADFMLREYDQCWEYIKFHYEQRDRSQRFYFTFVLGAGALVIALFQRDEPLELPYLLLLIVPLVLVGILTLGQMIQLRRTTTLFHKTIVTIRSQLRGAYKTPLWLSDAKPRYYATRFNFFTVSIVMLVTAAAAGSGALVIFLDIPKVKLWLAISVSLVFAALLYVLQQVWYRRVLRKEDQDYQVPFHEAQNTC